MAKKKSAPVDGYVRKETLWTAVMLSLAAGFFIGVVFTIFKSPPTMGTPGAPPAASRAPSGGLSDEQAARLFELERKAEATPDNPDIWAEIGHIYFDGGNAEKAIEAYEKSLAIAPDNANVLTDLGVMYRRNGKPEMAVAQFDKAIAADASHQVSRFNKGIVLIHDLKDLDGGIAAWESLLEVNPLAMAPNGQSVDELVTQFRAMRDNASGAKGKPSS
jgi:cytochrome c-type biogenesis protein CcmH/NrfG